MAKVNLKAGLTSIFPPVLQGSFMHMKGEPMAGKENREIKNSVFVDLFYEDESAEANEIALFNAIHDKPLPEGTKIRRFRVDNTIYMNFQNDLLLTQEGK